MQKRTTVDECWCIDMLAIPTHAEAAYWCINVLAFQTHAEVGVGLCMSCLVSMSNARIVDYCFQY
jgi:hypothetical protein